MIQLNPRHWQVLKDGSQKQCETYKILLETGIFETLKPFDPAHVGTIGNDLDIPGSDIDIICSANDFSALSNTLNDSFSSYPGFSLKTAMQRGVEALIATIPTPIPIEVYAESTPVNHQLGYRHYLIACRVLDVFGEVAHQDIRALKLLGHKTEPAFAEYLGLSGDPYISFLKLEQMSDQVIRLLRAARTTQTK
jgi:hypothetical protein